MIFDTTTANNNNGTEKSIQSTKSDYHLAPRSDADSSIQAIKQQAHKNKTINPHHWDQHELENARLLESGEGMDGMDGDLALLLNDLSMTKPNQPSYFMPYCA